MRAVRRDLPGADLVATGVDDLLAGRLSAEALLVSIGAPRLIVSGGFDPPSLRSAVADAIRRWG
ncbi:MAG: hypothetical protein ACT4PW_06345 [Acidimicrobiia bacterium]